MNVNLKACEKICGEGGGRVGRSNLSKYFVLYFIFCILNHDQGQ